MWNRASDGAADSVEERGMCTERWIRMVAGAMVMGSAAGVYFHSPYWLLLTAFVGLNMFQSALTNWCLLEDILRLLGVPGCQPKPPLRGSAAS
jgi:hypothetical protein